MSGVNNAQGEWEALRLIVKEIISAADKAGLLNDAILNKNPNQSNSDLGVMLHRVLLASMRNSPTLDTMATFRQLVQGVLKQQITPNDISQQMNNDLSNMQNSSAFKSQLTSKLSLTEGAAVSDAVSLILDEITGTLKADPNPEHRTKALPKPSPYTI